MQERMEELRQGRRQCTMTTQRGRTERRRRKKSRAEMTEGEKERRGKPFLSEETEW